MNYISSEILLALPQRIKDKIARWTDKNFEDTSLIELRWIIKPEIQKSMKELLDVDTKMATKEKKIFFKDLDRYFESEEYLNLSVIADLKTIPILTEAEIRKCLKYYAGVIPTITEKKDCIVASIDPTGNKVNYEEFIFETGTEYISIYWEFLLKALEKEV